jgi:hypothetical protein
MTGQAPPRTRTRGSGAPRRASWLLATVLLLAACATARYQSPGEDEATVLVVRNDNYLDHVIYLLQGAERVRLGTARGLTTTRLQIPRQYVFGPTTLQFLGDPIGSRNTPVSERVTVVPGDEVHLWIRGT